MVKSAFHITFKRKFSKIKDKTIKDKLLKSFLRLRDQPESGKPMKYSRKGTREIYVGSYRLAYSYSKKEDKIILLNLYHKDEQ